MKKAFIIAIATLSLYSCSWINENPDSLVTDVSMGDSPEACDAWVTGTYSKWIYDMFCWGYFPRMLVQADMLPSISIDATLSPAAHWYRWSRTLPS